MFRVISPVARQNYDQSKKDGRKAGSLDKGGNNIFYLRLVDKHHSVAVGWEIGLSPLIHFIPITWNYTRYGLIQADARAISGNMAASPAPLSNSSHLLACLVVLFFFLSPNCFPKQWTTVCRLQLLSCPFDTVHPIVTSSLFRQVFDVREIDWLASPFLFLLFSLHKRGKFWRDE